MKVSGTVKQLFVYRALQSWVTISSTLLCISSQVMTFEIVLCGTCSLLKADNNPFEWPQQPSQSGLIEVNAFKYTV